MKPLVIYHSADFDGLFSCEIARKALGSEADYLGWNYGDPLPDVGDRARLVYMIDISIDGLMDLPNLIWIDHHASAIAKYPDLPGYKIDGVAACRLAWQWFLCSKAMPLPVKSHYVNRQVDEPLAVRLAGEYDIFDHRDSRAKLFQHGLRSQELNEDDWRDLLDVGTSVSMTFKLLEQAPFVAYAQQQKDGAVIRKSGFTVEWEGLTFLACNASPGFNSHLFAAGIRPEHDALIGFNYDGKNRKWKYSMYGVPGKPDVDLGAIAVKYGGGGHKQACGFEGGTLLPMYGGPIFDPSGE